MGLSNVVRGSKNATGVIIWNLNRKSDIGFF